MRKKLLCKRLRDFEKSGKNMRTVPQLGRNRSHISRSKSRKNVIRVI